MCISNLFGGCGNNGCTWILFLIVLLLLCDDDRSCGCDHGCGCERNCGCGC